MDREQKEKIQQKVKLLHFIKRIPIFAELSEYHAKLILTICNKVVVPERGILCHKCDVSDSMFILLVGKLVVKIDDSTVVSTINPISSIGEMGVFTGEGRSANVEAVEKCNLLMLSKRDIDTLINRDAKFGVTIMRKVIKILSQRIADDNIRISQFKNYVVSNEEIEELKKETDS